MFGIFFKINFKPDIVFFGESLPNRVWRNVDSDFNTADLLLVFGTSLVVQPFCSFITKTGTYVPHMLPFYQSYETWKNWSPRDDNGNGKEY